MATTTQNVTINTTNPYMIGLLHDDGSTPGVSPEIVTRWVKTSPVTWYLAPGDFNTNGLQDWTEHGAGAAMQNALNAWQAVSGLTFQQVFTEGAANLVERINDAGGFLGTHEYPFIASTQAEGNYGQNATWMAPNNNAIGGYSYITLIHELGHGLGLEHPHVDGTDDAFPGVGSGPSDPFNDMGDNNLNQGIWTVMSYIDGWDQGGGISNGGTTDRPYGWAGTPMAFDIAAIQLLYGANTTTGAGNTVYTLKNVNAVGTYWSCIWDVGGTDTIRAAVGSNTNVTINLNDATLLNAVGGGGFVSRHTGIFGGFTIANTVVIENATGANGNDTLVGNEFANVLLGGNGNDSLSGQNGSDTLSGGNGTDTLNGGANNDIYSLGSEASVDTLVDASGTDTVFTLITRSIAPWAFIENLLLQGAANINGTGNNGFNGIAGNNGSNVLAGMGGNDALDGKGGNDFLYGQGGQDSIIGGLGNDTFVYQQATDSVAGPTCDYIRDFDDANDDRINLQNVFVGTLVYRGTGAFTAVVGEVRIDDIAGPHLVVAIDLDADPAPEMQILLLGTIAADMTIGDFLL